MTRNHPAEPVMRTGEKWLTCNGRQLKKLALAGLNSLENNHPKVNALNVFPVPDGDTGTNMLLTMRAAYKRIRNNEDTHVGRVAQEISQGALMGARGNSGVILSQILRGLAASLKDKQQFDANDLAAAFQEASDTAYKGVMRPVEGTILTVIREAAEEAGNAVGKSNDLRFVLERVLERCQQVLAQTPEMLPVLKQAGVVDAGGQGLVYLLEGMLHRVYGKVLESQLVIEDDLPAQAKAAPEEGIENPYDVQFILLGDDMDVLKVRTDIDAMGDSTVIVGDEKMIKVHVHVKDPGEPISYGIRLGRITDVVVENMQLQMEEIISQGGTTAVNEEPSQLGMPVVSLEPGQVGVVAVAAGKGLADIFRSLGAAGIVNGGQSNNPSTEEIFEAVQDVPTNKVVILPNNKNIILAAEAARDLSTKEVVVIPSRTFPQGVSALLSLNPNGSLEDVSESMKVACGHVTSGEITLATRSVDLNGVAVHEGEYIGIADGRLCASGQEIDGVLPLVLEAMSMDDRELLSIYYGADVDQTAAENLAEQIGSLYPDLEVEVLFGGQAIYHYILGAE
ncbi:MAG: DAK2 domain-containing protein [Candidatus Promineifilaceae bacterium]